MADIIQQFICILNTPVTKGIFAVIAICLANK